MIIHVQTVAEFDELIKKEKVLVDYFATWCGPCRMLGEVIEELDQDNIEGLTIVKVDVDQLSELAIRYRIQAVPTLMLFKAGELVNNAMGYKNKNELLAFISK